MKSKKHVFTLPVVSLVVLGFILGTSEFVVVGILPEIAEGFQVSLTRAGSIVSVFAFTYALGTPFFAALAGKYNRFRFTVLCMGIFVAANLLCAAAPFYWIFLAFRVVTAVVSGTLVSIAMTFAKDVAVPENVSKVIAGIFSGFSIASVLGVPIAAAITHAFGFRIAFALISVAGGVLMYILYKVLPRENKHRAYSVMGQFIIFRDKRIVLGVLAVLLGAAGTYTVYTYLTPVFQTELKIPDKMISAALLAFGVAAIISNLASGKIAGAYGVKIMPGIYGVHTLCLFLLPFTCRNLAAGGVTIFAAGVFMYLMNSPSQLLFLSVAAKDYPSCINLASSFNAVFFNFGIAVGSVFGGVLVDSLGMRYLGLGGGVFTLAAGICCGVLVSNMKLRE